MYLDKAVLYTAILFISSPQAEIKQRVKLTAFREHVNLISTHTRLRLIVRVLWTYLGYLR